MERDPVTMMFLSVSATSGLVLLIGDVRRLRDGKDTPPRPVRQPFEILFHLSCLLGGLLGMLFFNWIIPVFGLLAFVLAVIAYRFPPQRGPSDPGAPSRGEGLVERGAPDE